MNVRQNTYPPNALELLESNLKTDYRSSTTASPVRGVAPTVNASTICGECSDEGGGSSGQCACDK